MRNKSSKIEWDCIYNKDALIKQNSNPKEG